MPRGRKGSFNRLTSLMPKSRYSAYPRKFIIEVLEIYKNHPCLWNYKLEEYFDRGKKDEAYEKIVNKLQEVEKFPDRHMVISLFSALRLNYRKELKLVEQGQKTTLWYFKYLDFLRDCLLCKRKYNTIQVIENDKTEYETESVGDDNESHFESSAQLSVQTSWNSIDPSFESPIFLKSEISFASPNNVDQEDYMEQQSEQPSSKYFDEIGKTWARILRESSSEQQIIAEKIISDIIYEARMEKLTDEIALDLIKKSQSQRS